MTKKTTRGNPLLRKPRPRKGILCKACKHRMTRHAQYCMQYGCWCRLPYDQQGDLAIIEREKDYIRQKKKEHRSYLRRLRKSEESA